MIEAVVLEYLRKTIEPSARCEHGQCHVEYGNRFKAVVIAAWLVAIGIALLTHYAADIGRTTGLIVTAGFCLLALYLHLEVFHCRIRYSPVELHAFSAWRRNVRAPWSEIRSVSLSRLSQNWVVTLRSGERFTFNYFMSGYGSLLDELEKHLP